MEAGSGHGGHVASIRSASRAVNTSYLTTNTVLCACVGVVTCRACALGKSSQLPRNTAPARRATADHKLGEVSLDFHGPYDVPGVHGERYCMVLVDGHSGSFRLSAAKLGFLA